MADAPKILGIEGDEALAEDLITRLEHKGFKPQLAKNRSQASALPRRLRFDAMLTKRRSIAGRRRRKDLSFKFSTGVPPTCSG